MTQAQAKRCNDRIIQSLERVLDAIEDVIQRDSDNLEHGEYSIDDWGLESLKGDIEDGLIHQRRIQARISEGVIS